MFIHLPYEGDAVRKLGRVADFCPICRRPTEMVLRMHGTAWHWAGLRFSPISLKDYSKDCGHCGTRQRAEEGHYRELVRWRRPPLPELISRTQPNLAQKYAHRLELEGRLLVAPELLTPEERAALIREPFDVLAPRIEQAFTDKVWDLPTYAALAYTIAAPFLAMSLASTLAPENIDLLVWSAFGAVAVGVVALLVLNYGSPGRFLRRNAFPRIARTLRPLEPTAEELAAALAQQQALGRPVGRKPPHLAWMLAALERAAA